jgi:phage shock protein A
MGIMSWFAGLVATVLNRFLAAAENPATATARLVRAIESNVEGARRHAAAAIASERRLKWEFEQHCQMADRWRSQARDAFSKGQMDRFRYALACSREHREFVFNLKPYHEAALKACEKAKGALRKLGARLTHARHFERALLARYQAVRAWRRFHERVQREIVDPVDFEAPRDRLTQQISELENELTARVHDYHAAIGAGSIYVGTMKGQPADILEENALPSQTVFQNSISDECGAEPH